MFKIKNRIINSSHEPFIIAEVSANHNGSVERAKKTMAAAKENGAHAVKIQTYEADTMTIDCDKADFMIKGGLWDGYKLYDLYKEAYTPFAWHQKLFDFAKKIDVTLFSTPFDESAVELLESLDAPAYKIASFELTDLPLIQRAARTKKPILMSTGMASETEIGEAVEAARSAGADSILLFHCISSYPAPTEEAQLRNILSLKKQFQVEVGLSDHTVDHTAAIGAVALGAVAIEKHFTIDRSEKGPDSDFSIEPHELKSLVETTRKAWLSLGKENFSRPETESKSKVFRRSLYFVKDLKAGALITKEDIRRIRPGYGLAPKHFDEILGKKLSKDVSRGEAVSWSAFSDE